jgi:hypothetical protein
MVNKARIMVLADELCSADSKPFKRRPSGLAILTPRFVWLACPIGGEGGVDAI